MRACALASAGQQQEHITKVAATFRKGGAPLKVKQTVARRPHTTASPSTHTSAGAAEIRRQTCPGSHLDKAICRRVGIWLYMCPNTSSSTPWACWP